MKCQHPCHAQATMGNKNTRDSSSHSSSITGNNGTVIAAGPVSSEAKDELSPLLKQIRHNDIAVKAVVLGSRFIGASRSCQLAMALADNTHITHVDLSDNGMGTAGAKAMAAALLTNTSITELHMGFNSIQNEGADAIAHAIAKNCTLTELRLRNNSIGPSGAVAIATALKSNTSITVLDISSNGIADDGAFALADALLVNCTLKVLYVYNNNIGDDGVAAIARAVMRNTTLEELYGVDLAASFSALHIPSHVSALHQDSNLLLLLHTKPQRQAGMYLTRICVRPCSLFV